MEIHAGGKVWDVETEASRSIAAGGEDSRGVTFRDRSDREGQVAIGWVPRAGSPHHERGACSSSPESGSGGTHAPE